MKALTPTDLCHEFIKRDKKARLNYTVYSPDNLNFPLGIINHKGAVLSGVNALEVIIVHAKNGTAKDKANNLLCVPNLGVPKENDVITLGEIFGKSTIKDKGLTKKLIAHLNTGRKIIAPVRSKNSTGGKSGNRYLSKVDWKSDRVKNQVQGLLAHGESLAFIARHLGVTKSTLTKANKRNNYRLYYPNKKHH